jgi:anti-anti-sigma factor
VQTDPDLGLHLTRHGSVAVIKVQDEEVRHPAHAQELGDRLSALIDREGLTQVLIDLSRTKYMGSTAFATLLVVAKKLKEAGGTLKVCGMNRDLLVGANIIGLGRAIDVCDDERSGIGSFPPA